MRFSILGLRRGRRRESGQGLVELSLILPILLVLVVGLAEIGDAMNSYLTVIEASRDAARLGSRSLASDAELKQLIGRDMERLSDPFDPAEDASVQRDTMPGDESVTVEVCYDHNLILDFVLFIPNPIHLCSTTTMRSIVDVE
jgi:hypothetical protein